MAKRVDRDMRAAIRDLLHRSHHIGVFRGVDRHHRADLPREIELFRREVDGDDIGAHRGRDHDHRHPDAAAAMHGHPLSRLHPPPVDDRAKGRDKAAAETSGSGEVEVLVQPHQIGVGEVERDKFCERPPGGEPWLELLFADLMVAGRTLEAVATPTGEGRRHPVPGTPVLYLTADSRDRSGKLMPGHVRQHDIGIMAHPAMPVAAAKPGSLDLDHDTMRRGNGIGDVPHTWRRSKLFVHHGFHRHFPSSARRSHRRLIAAQMQRFLLLMPRRFQDTVQAQTVRGAWGDLLNPRA